jgi:hypothetical protein
MQRVGETPNESRIGSDGAVSTEHRAVSLEFKQSELKIADREEI